MPARSTAEIWTNTSFEPSSGWMKPKPLVRLNHFTVPAAIMCLLKSVCSPPDGVLNQISFGRIRSAEQKQRVIWTDPKQNVTYPSISHHRNELPITDETADLLACRGGVAVDKDSC